MTNLVTVQDLTVEYHASGRTAFKAVDQASFEIAEGATLGIVGESGSGKSTLARTMVGLIKPTTGSLRFDDQELVGLRRRQWRSVRRQVQVVFQNPLLSLSPRIAIGRQFEEPLQVHTELTRAQRTERIDETLDSLDLSPTVKTRFPHEMSGGQAQRVVLARALLLRPRLIIFDEPTSALDVSVQASVLNLLGDLKQEYGLTYMFITHDLAVARHIADRIVVMKSGQIVESQPTPDLFARPQHDYTVELLASSIGL